MKYSIKLCLLLLTISMASFAEQHKRKLAYLYVANGGLIGYFNDGTVVGCPTCDLCRNNISSLYKMKVIKHWNLHKPDHFTSYHQDNGWVLVNYKWHAKVPY
jgi:hypothetical protein